MTLQVCNDHFGNNDLGRTYLISFHLDHFSSMIDPPSTLCCAPRPVIACCDICNPGHFIFPVEEPTDKPPKAACKHIPKLYNQGTAEESLHKALVSLHRDLAKDEVLMLTAKAFMSDTILDQIVDLAHYQLIKTVAALHKQITWGYLDTCASRILELVTQHCPPPVVSSPFTTAPLQVAMHIKLFKLSQYSCRCQYLHCRKMQVHALWGARPLL